MRRSIYLTFIKVFKEFIAEIGLDDASSHFLIFDGHPSLVTIDVFSYFKANGIHIVQLPLRSSHITQLSDVYAFDILKHQLTDILTTFLQKNGVRRAVKSDIAYTIHDA